MKKSIRNWRQRVLAVALVLLALAFWAFSAAPEVNPSGSSPQTAKYEYRLLATNKTSTMEKEANEAAAAGFRFEGIMGGETGFGGSEAVTVMSKLAGVEVKPRWEYKLLATNKTTTMQKEMQAAGDAGFEYKDQTVFSSTFGGKEVVVIMEHDRESPIKRYEYRLLATNRTGTMQKELMEAGEAGFAFVGITVAKSAFGGSETICILRRPAQ